jgi:hypothetical protein
MPSPHVKTWGPTSLAQIPHLRLVVMLSKTVTTTDAFVPSRSTITRIIEFRAHNDLCSTRFKEIDTLNSTRGMTARNYTAV